MVVRRAFYPDDASEVGLEIRVVDEHRVDLGQLYSLVQRISVAASLEETFVVGLKQHVP